MSTVSFKESLTYGGRLFALWVVVTVLGGGIAALGGYLVVPELQSLITDGTATVGTASLAGGVLFVLLGAGWLVAGNFAVLYKLLADSVSRGTRADSPDTLADSVSTPTEAVDDSGQTDDSEPVRDQEPEQRPSASEDQGPAQVPASEQPTAETVKQPAERTTVADTADTEPTATGTEQPPETGQHTAESFEPENRGQQVDEKTERRERTAEEIAFGAGGEPSQDETETDATASVDDEEWFDEQSASQESGDEPETFDEEPTEDIDRSSMETANDSSSDPLVDQFDDK